MNLEKAKQEFLKYASNYDKTHPKIDLKIHHSLRVMEMSKKIAESLGLTKEQIDIATLIGLLHDIGRFEQVKRYNTFKDFLSIDHGDLGVEILQKDAYIRKFIEEEKYDKIILKAIKNHNKYAIEDGLTEEELLYAKIIKDADKLDIFYESTIMFWSSEEEFQKVENASVTPKVMEQFNQEILVNRQEKLTGADDVVGMVSFIFDIYFKLSFEILKKEDYLGKLIARFEFKNKDVKETMQEVNEMANRYIEKRLKD